MQEKWIIYRHGEKVGSSSIRSKALEMVKDMCFRNNDRPSAYRVEWGVVNG